MADGDQNQQQPPRHWFPYWSGAPKPPQPPSRRLSPPSLPVTPSPSQHHQPTAATATRGAAPPQAASPLAPIIEPPPPNDSNVAPYKPVTLPAALKHKDVDIVLPPEKSVVHPLAAEIKPHGHGTAAADKEHKPHHHKEIGKDGHKSKDREKKDETKIKVKDKEKEKKHHAHAGEESQHKESKAEHGEPHGEIKAGVADMVHKTTGAAASGHPSTSVITLAGENKGASMNVSGGKSKDGKERLDGTKPAGSNKQGMTKALINSNVQAINNSLLLESSCSGGDPGVHLKLSAKSTAKDKQKQKHAGDGDKETRAATNKLAPSPAHRSICII